MLLLLLALAPPAPPEDPIAGTLEDGERWGDHLAVARLVAEGRIPADNARVQAIEALAAAEAALAAGDDAGAADAASRVAVGSPLYPRARLVLGEAEAALGDPKAAANAWRSAAEDRALRDQVLQSMAGLYVDIHSFDHALSCLRETDERSPWLATALARMAEIYSLGRDETSLRKGLGGASAALGPRLVDQTFAPDLRVTVAWRLMDVCWQPEADLQIQQARARLDALDLVVDTLSHSTGAALWDRLDRGDLYDTGLSTWMALDALVSRPTRLAAALTHAGERPDDAGIYRSEAVAAARRRLSAARDMLAHARQDLAGAMARQAAERLPDRGEACRIQAEHLIWDGPAGSRDFNHIIKVSSSFGGTHGEAWTDELNSLRFTGQSRCSGPRGPAELNCVWF